VRRESPGCGSRRAVRRAPTMQRVDTMARGMRQK